MSNSTETNYGAKLLDLANKPDDEQPWPPLAPDAYNDIMTQLSKEDADLAGIEDIRSVYPKLDRFPPNKLWVDVKDLSNPHTEAGVAKDNWDSVRDQLETETRILDEFDGFLTRFFGTDVSGIVTAMSGRLGVANSQIVAISANGSGSFDLAGALIDVGKAFGPTVVVATAIGIIKSVIEYSEDASGNLETVIAAITTQVSNASEALLGQNRATYEGIAANWGKLQKFRDWVQGGQLTTGISVDEYTAFGNAFEVKLYQALLPSVMGIYRYIDSGSVPYGGTCQCGNQRSWISSDEDYEAQFADDNNKFCTHLSGLNVDMCDVTGEKNGWGQFTRYTVDNVTKYERYGGIVTKISTVIVKPENNSSSDSSDDENVAFDLARSHARAAAGPSSGIAARGSSPKSKADHVRSILKVMKGFHKKHEDPADTLGHHFEKVVIKHTTRINRAYKRDENLKKRIFDATAPLVDAKSFAELEELQITGEHITRWREMLQELAKADPKMRKDAAYLIRFAEHSKSKKLKDVLSMKADKSLEGAFRHVGKRRQLIISEQTPDRIDVSLTGARNFPDRPTVTVPYLFSSDDSRNSYYFAVSFYSTIKTYVRSFIVSAQGPRPGTLSVFETAIGEHNKARSKSVESKWARED